MTKNTTQIGRELSERLNPGMEDALNAALEVFGSEDDET
jgi:hypothetical protein